MSDEPRGDLGAAVQMLAADNARLCGLALAADKLAEAVEKALRSPRRTEIMIELSRCLEAYKQARTGQ